MATPVTMPQLGETVVEGTIVKWLKSEGDQVERDEPLFEISTDKVDTEVPSPVAGTLKEIKVKEGETVSVGTELAVIDEAGGGGGEQPKEAEPPRPRPSRRARSRPAPAGPSSRTGSRWRRTERAGRTPAPAAASAAPPSAGRAATSCRRWSGGSPRSTTST